ncbi:hypothetical protein PSHT_07027, partial [Puccinia striiformis]
MPIRSHDHFKLGLNVLEGFIRPFVEKGLRSVMLFGVPMNCQKDAVGTPADDENGLTILAIRLLKEKFPRLFVAADVCLCEYTDHGHCGFAPGQSGGEIDTPASVARIAAVALSYARAGADCVAPSDMMDGRIGAIKQALIDARLANRCCLMSYSAKFASALYGPFRAAACSAPSLGDRKGYQLPPNARGLARRAIIRDISEGADIIMVKPAQTYLDVVSEARSLAPSHPLACYQVSGEYAALLAGADAGVYELKSMVLETLDCMLRAGATLILTYFTPMLLDWLLGVYTQFYKSDNPSVAMKQSFYRPMETPLVETNTILPTTLWPNLIVATALHPWRRHKDSDPLVIFNQVEIRAELSDQLRSKRLPSLKRQVIALLNAFVCPPSDIENKPGYILNLVIKILSKLDVTLGKIKFAIACIDPGLESKEVKHDNEFGQAKHFVCSRLGLITSMVTGHVCELLAACGSSMEEFGYTFAVDQPRKKAEVLKIKETCLDSIDRTLEFLNKSELSFMQDALRAHIEMVNAAHKKFIKFINRPAPKSATATRRLTCYLNGTGNRRAEIGKLRNRTYSTLLVIATIRLTRLFLEKMLKISTDTENFKMRDFQICRNDYHAFRKYREAYPLCGEITQDQLQDIMTIHRANAHLQCDPKRIFFAINHIFVSVDHQVEQPPHKIYYKNWFYEWNKLHWMVRQKFIDSF